MVWSTITISSPFVYVFGNYVIKKDVVPASHYLKSNQDPDYCHGLLWDDDQLIKLFFECVLAVL